MEADKLQSRCPRLTASIALTCLELSSSRFENSTSKSKDDMLSNSSLLNLRLSESSKTFLMLSDVKRLEVLNEGIIIEKISLTVLVENSLF